MDVDDLSTICGKNVASKSLPTSYFCIRTRLLICFLFDHWKPPQLETHERMAGSADARMHMDERVWK